MDKILDYECTIENETILDSDVLKELGIFYPEVHTNKTMMIKASVAFQEQSKALFCELPFCHTLEAENIGGNINYGNEINGPRAAEYLTSSCCDLLELPDFDFEKGRMKTVLEAVEQLSKEKTVLLNVSGPFTLLNVLIDPKYLFKTMRKEPRVIKQIFNKLEDELICYLEVAKTKGVKIISYADSAGSLNILGPKYTKDYVDVFVYPFLKKAVEVCGNEMILVLCPKTTFALVGTKKAVFKESLLSNQMSYQEAIISLIGTKTIVGQLCIKDKNTILLNNKVKSVVLT